MPNEPVKITAQELEGIKKLPSCQFMLGGTPQTGFFDKVNEKIYYLDSEGNWMVIGTASAQPTSLFSAWQPHSHLSRLLSGALLLFWGLRKMRKGASP